MRNRRQCHYCSAARDLRPYGPGGAWVCFPCATATPAREEAAKAEFLSKLDEAGPLVALDEGGPRPLSDDEVAMLAHSVTGGLSC